MMEEAESLPDPPIERERSTRALLESQNELRAELADSRLLQQISSALIGEDRIDEFYAKLLDAAAAIMRADFASMQMFHPTKGQLQLLAHKNFPDDAAAFWEWVEAGEGSTCGQALASAERSIVADIESCAFMAGTDDLKFYRSSGMRAVQSTPLIGRDGRVVGMLSTHWSKPHQPSARELGMFDVLARQAADLIERTTAEAALRESESRYRDIVESAKEYAIITLDPQRRILTWNSGAERLLGYAGHEVMGQLGDIFFTPEDRVAGAPAREVHLAQTEGRGDNERWHVRKNGSRFWGSGVMLPGGHGKFVKIFRDRTEERRAEQRQRLMVDELNHRVKNTLAIVQSLAQQTFRAGEASERARLAFEGRLEALATAHNVLTREHWESADLKQIVADSLAACRGHSRHFHSSGPSVRLEPRIAVTVAMALHELCTNAIKYGALSVADGCVDVHWIITDEEPSRLLIRWQESGGPPVDPPAGRGFGSRMIERALATDMKAEVRMDYRREGLVCTIDSPVPPLPEADAKAGNAGE